jgi:chemotaxis protein MotB
MLSLEKGRNADLSASVAELTQDLQAARAARDAAASEASGLQDALAKAGAARDAAAAEGETLKARVADEAVELDSAQKRLAVAETRLADTADRASAENLARLTDQVRALLALRDQLAAQAAAANQKLAESSRLADSAQAQVALLTKQVDALRVQLAQVAAALDLAHRDSAAKDVRIADLGARLNEALVSKVAELQRYRSEFFGRLRDVLAGRPGITVVGDRFVFQSEVLFPPGSADLSPAGRDEIRKLAATLKDLSAKIPADIPWVLRVDGHADRQAVRGKFASNWELSAERAINVVRLLAGEGIPPNRLAAAGFGEFQPIDTTNSPTAYAKNRRIELRLTDR